MEEIIQELRTKTQKQFDAVKCDFDLLNEKLDQAYDGLNEMKHDVNQVEKEIFALR